MRIGLFGAGIMGRGITANLLKAGHTVTVIAHRNRVPIDALVAQGAREAATPQDLASASEVILICVTDTKAAEAVVTSFVPAFHPETLVIDMTTHSVEGPPALEALIEEAQGRYVEAPLTGGAKQAEEGVLGAIVGCAEADLEDATAVLSCFCKGVEHFGPVGMGAKTKLLSNFLALGTAALVIETFGRARDMGVDWQKLYALAQLGSGNSAGLKRIIGNAVQGDYGGYVFTVANTAKDFGYITQMMAAAGAPSDVADALKARFDAALDAGLGDKLISELLDPDNSSP